MASPNNPSTLSRRAEWSTFDSVLALFADSLSNRIFCLKVSVSCSMGAGRGAFLSLSALAPRTAMRITRSSSRDCLVVSLACDSAGPSLPSMSCSLWSCFRNFSTVSRRFLELLLQEPPIRGGFAVLRFLLCQLVFGGRSLRLGCPADCKILRESPSQANRSCPLQPTRLRGGSPSGTSGKARGFGTRGFRWSRLGQRTDTLWTKGTLLMIVERQPSSSHAVHGFHFQPLLDLLFDLL